MNINNITDIEKHLFKNIDFFPNDIKTLILGSFPVPLYTQREKFFNMSLKDRNNSWYYGSKKNEFWKIINEVYYSDKKYENFLYNKKEKINLFSKNKIGIADVISKCKRKNKESSKDTDLIILDYNNKIIDLLKQSRSLMRILFMSRFTENHFFKMLKKNNIEYSLKDLNITYANLLSGDILKAVKYRTICFKNKNIEIATITIKISPIKGVSLYSTKCALFKYFLQNA